MTHFENSIVKDESFLHSASIADLSASTDRNVRSNLGGRVDFSSFVDEARFDNSRSTSLVGGS